MATDSEHDSPTDREYEQHRELLVALPAETRTVIFAVTREIARGHGVTLPGPWPSPEEPE
jgi:hypothetical protein